MMLLMLQMMMMVARSSPPTRLPLSPCSPVSFHVALALPPPPPSSVPLPAFTSRCLRERAIQSQKHFSLLIHLINVCGISRCNENARNGAGGKQQEGHATGTGREWRLYKARENKKKPKLITSVKKINEAISKTNLRPGSGGRQQSGQLPILSDCCVPKKRGD